MSNQTSEAFAYIEREHKNAKSRVELQRHVVAQLHMVEADAGEAEAALNALLDDERLSCASWTTCEGGWATSRKKCHRCPQHSLLRLLAGVLLTARTG